MSALCIELDRVNVSLADVSSLVVEQALDGLEAELRRRLSERDLRRVGAAEIPSLGLGPLEVPPRVDAAQLRTLLAEQLADAVRQAGRQKA